MTLPAANQVRTLCYVAPLVAVLLVLPFVLLCSALQRLGLSAAAAWLSAGNGAMSPYTIRTHAQSARSLFTPHGLARSSRPLAQATEYCRGSAVVRACRLLFALRALCFRLLARRLAATLGRDAADIWPRCRRVPLNVPEGLLLVYAPRRQADQARLCSLTCCPAAPPADRIRLASWRGGGRRRQHGLGGGDPDLLGYPALDRP